MIKEITTDKEETKATPKIQGKVVIIIPLATAAAPAAAVESEVKIADYEDYRRIALMKAGPHPQESPL